MIPFDLLILCYIKKYLLYHTPVINTYFSLYLTIQLLF